MRRWLDKSRERAAGGNQRRHRARFNLRGRLALIAGVLGVSFVALLARAVDLQLIDNEFYRKQGDARFVREIEVPAIRGMITDRNGEPLAVSSPVESLWANPQELGLASARIPELAQALGVSADDLRNQVSQRASREFMWLRRRMNPAQAQAIVALGIPGVYSQREFRRFYPQGEAVAHVLGFTNIDDAGQEGVELAFNDWLAGKPGAKRVIRDRDGRIVESVDLVRAAEPGRDLTLSIDRRIQFLAYRELREALERANAASGSAVVLDVATGEVLAMVNLPSFNPNAVDARNREAHRNRAITDLFEPGSTIKPLTVALGLEKGVINTNSTFNTSPGWIANGRFRTTDVRNHGVLSTTGLIQKSSNVGMALIAQKLENRDMYEFMRRFGFGQTTGSGFPGEGAGLFLAPERWDGTTRQTMSYGYALSVTPLQITHAYAALANQGRQLPVTFVKGEHGQPKQVLDPAIAGQVMRMMQTVTEPGGTATQAAILGYHVAGKTGTARKASGGGYSRRYISYFAGVVPVENPRFAMAVAVNEPTAGSYYGGVVAAPVFRNVMEGALRLMDVPPDDIETWLAAQARHEPKLAATAPAAAPAAARSAPTTAEPAPRLPRPIDLAEATP